MPLPLKARISIRDHWDNPDYQLQENIKKLKAVMGSNVAINPDWAILLAELQSSQSDVVLKVADYVHMWLQTVIDLLEPGGDAPSDPWSDMVIDKVAEAGNTLRVFIDVRPMCRHLHDIQLLTSKVGNAKEATTKWSDQMGGFTITLPKKLSETANSWLYRDELLSAFNPEPTSAPTATLSTACEAPALPSAPSPSSPTFWGLPKRTAYAPDTLPSLASLERPDQLLRSPPYYLSIFDGGPVIEVQSTHSPTLEFLAEYLQKWCRTDHHQTDHPPLVNFELKQSPFALGKYYDRLMLRDERHTRVVLRGAAVNERVLAPGILLHLAERLGYVLVDAHGGWTFRRDQQFRER